MENSLRTADSSRSLIDRFQGMIHERLQDLVSDEPLAILDFPDIRNCGDSAIWLGEMAYLRDAPRQAAGVCLADARLLARGLERVVPEGPIFIHGGGNFGDVWVAHQDFRERVLERFPDRRIIQFPQSIHYKSTSGSRRASASSGATGIRAAGARRGVAAVRREALRLRSAAVPGHGVLHRRAPAGRTRVPRARDAARGPREGGGTEQSAYPDIPIEDWITESGGGCASRRRSAPLPRCWRSGRPRCGCASWTPLRTTASGAASGRSPRARARHRPPARPHLLAAARQAARRARQQLRQDPALHGRLLGHTTLSYRATSLEDGIAWARNQAAAPADP